MSNNEKGKKSLLSPKAKQIVDIVFTTLQVIVVILCIVFSVIIWTGAAGDPNSRSLNWFAIRTDSMVKNDALDYDALGYDSKLCFNPGDMVIVKKVNKDEIKIGDVIAYKDWLKDPVTGNRSEEIVTHRVVRIDEDGHFITYGDKDTERTEPASIGYPAVIGKMTGKMSGVGGAVLWLQGYKKVTGADGTVTYVYSGNSVTFLVIIIPLALLFIYNGFYVVKWAMGEKMKKAKEQARLEAVKEQANASIDQDAIRKEALRAMMMANGMTAEQIDAYFASQENSNAETNKSEENAETTDNVSTVNNDSDGESGSDE